MPKSHVNAHGGASSSVGDVCSAEAVNEKVRPKVRYLAVQLLLRSKKNERNMYFLFFS